ncbi:hypothetical protein CCACVL1_29874 [Corchorus capsularis]|uniref:Uncharacterized protein n=1 Tax=Corchorus capsularis TaxID=210143 RepID=A0A1R3FZR3_COCAP|nr:hypothetical protein CCACVL1_29874 [Corchorus capsularis]
MTNGWSRSPDVVVVKAKQQFTREDREA